jgi:hypothetical protein
MSRIYRCLLQLLGACIATVALGPALAQISNVTDGTTVSSACTSYTFSASGVLTFSPAGCLTSTTPPPANPVYSFTVGSAQVVETTPITTVTVRRTGASLSTIPAGSVIVRWTGGTAAANTNFKVDVPPFGSVGADFQATIAFAQPASGTTTQEVSFNVYVVNASLPGGTSKTVVFGLLNPTDGNLGATTSHTLTINSAAPPPSATDTSSSGAAIPDFLPVGTYAGKTLVCESFQATNVPGSPTPGLGGRTPCGGYDIVVNNTTRPAGAYNCNAGMLNTTQFYGGGIGNVTHSITSATMFVLEDLKNGNTYVPGVDFRYPQQQYNAFVIKFRTGNAGEFPAMGGTPPPGVLGQYTFGFVAQGNRGEPATRFAALSTQPCDFDYAKFDQGNACYKNLNQQGGGSLLAQIVQDGTVTPTAGNCPLLPNTVYYLSTRWEDVGFPGAGSARGAIACRPSPSSPTGQYCGTSLAIN